MGPYFDETPLKDSLGSTLAELQLDGDVNARLHLDIPLDGEQVTAEGMSHYGIIACLLNRLTVRSKI